MKSFLNGAAFLVEKRGKLFVSIAFTSTICNQWNVSIFSILTRKLFQSKKPQATIINACEVTLRSFFAFL